ncbi:hypothetical protein V7S43_013050 [Phytophthora oleae]|uniref:Uncharacterized protein n=1 Tax=Phytophthora oleae TaxID=2107226 RepID=A0ABD3F645_9STRA
MPLDNLIPLGGASGGKSGSKKSGSSDLTSGLISLSGARDNVDVDTSDFDVGDLLGDDSSKKAKSSSKNKSDDTKKKKKSKDKSSSSKKKSKSKKSAFDDSGDFGNDDADNWTSSAKNWDSTAELEMAAAAFARRKNGSGKMGGGFDDEFTKMLGGEIGGKDFGSPPSPEPIGGEKVGNFKSEDTFGISGYTPTVRGSKKFESAEVTTTASADNSAKRGIAASFFQDSDKDTLNSTSLSSLLGSTTERRGGARGGRRQTGAESDPFGFGTTTTTSSSTFDSLFGGSSSKRSALDDPFAKSTREQEDPKSRQQDPVIETKSDPVRDEAPSAPVTQHLSAKDDLLADLFPSEPRSSSRSDRRQQESTTKSEEVDYYEKKTRVDPTPEPTQSLPVADTAKQQNDLLAELFATPSSYKPREKEEEPRPKPETVKEATVTPPRQKTPPPEPVDSANTDLASARDSLLMDLLGDLSPPKPREPLLSRRRSRNTNNSNSNSPEKEVVKAEDPFKSSLPPSPVQTQSLPTVPEVPPAPTKSNERPPSPGRIRPLTMEKGSLVIRESDFEQSKDSLLEEILPSSPSASARSSPHRRNSYSQSFDVEDNIAVDAEEQINEAVEEQKSPMQEEEAPAPEPVASVVKQSSPPKLKTEPEASTSKPEPTHTKTVKQNDIQVVLAPTCNCEEREAKFTASFDLERAELKQKLDELTHQLQDQTTSSAQLTQQLTQQLEEREASALQLSQQLEARAAANAQLALQLTAAERDKLHADQLALASKEDAASYQHRAELLEAEMRSLREELTRSKRAQQDAELALARKAAEYDEADQLERHREKRALEALSAQMQRALARLTVSHQVQEEGSGYDNFAARVAAEDEARLRVIASLEGSSKRAAKHAEQERLKLAELLRDLEAGARNARQGALEDKERLRQEQQRLDALSAHFQAQATALRDQEAVHATYMGQQLAEAREDARVQESRLNTRRTQLERDERALYEARADFAAFREQTALEIEREYEELRASRLRLEDAWRELRTDREDLEAELASHEDEFQALESMREEVQEAETRLNERTQEVVALAEKLDAGTRDLLEREQLVAQQAAIVQDTDTSFSSRERALDRVKNELEAREQRLHVQIRQLDGARVRLTQQRREQQQLMAAAASRRHYSTPANAVDNNKRWRQSEFTSGNHSPPAEIKTKAKPWEAGLSEEDPSGLPPALRKQVEANWQRRHQQLGQRRYGSGLTFDLGDFDATSAYPPSWFKTKDGGSIEDGPTTKESVSEHLKTPATSQDLFKTPREQQATPTPSFRNPQLSHSARRSHQPPPSGAFQPTLRVNL